MAKSAIQAKKKKARRAAKERKLGRSFGNSKSQYKKKDPLDWRPKA